MLFLVIGILTLFLALAVILLIRSRRAGRKLKIFIEKQTQELEQKTVLLTEYMEKEESILAASRSRPLFIANLSHKLLTPINSIIGFAELALNDNLSLKTREYIKKLLGNAEGIFQIINDILDISKIEASRLELEKIPFDLHELFASCRMIVLPKADSKGIRLHFYAEPLMGIKLLGDPARLRQVFMNLLSNAIKFTDAGIIKICAAINRRSDKDVTIHFTVKDSGIGMSAEQIADVFEPFAQAETEITRKQGGAGLGLPLTKSIIALMGGKLLVESADGIGSKFSFDLTFNTIEANNYDRFAKKTQQEDIDDIQKPYLKGEILLCEDNEMNQQIFCDHAANVGLNVVVAENGKKGYELVKSRKENGKKQFDMIFMDIHMPEMDGIEASAKILELNTGIPIVAMTANAMINDSEIYHASGMFECIGKPFESQELWRCLVKYLEPENHGETENAGNFLNEDIEFKKSLQVMFLDYNQHKMEEISAALNDNNIVSAHRLAHSLKTNAAQLNYAGLQAAAADVEHQLKNEINKTTKESLKILEKELDDVISQIVLELKEQ